MKVLIVDDSALFRKGISQALAGEAGIDVLGVASNGKIALMKILQEKPDLIVLDLEMPEMDGLSVIKEIRRQNLAIWILVFSDQSERGAKKALEALAAGADDFLSKSIVKAEGDSVLHIRNELSPRIRQFMKETFVVQPEPIKEILPNLDHSYFS
jgi:two-component system chemotaxis response regulator CheB